MHLYKDSADSDEIKAMPILSNQDIKIMLRQYLHEMILKRCRAYYIEQNKKLS